MASTSIDPSELLPLPAWELARAERRTRVIALRAARRVEVGPHVSLVFENRETVLDQIQEMLRVERITAPDLVRREIEAYSDLLPGPGELSGTLFIEIADAEQRREVLSGLGGIEREVSFQSAGRALSRAQDKCPIDPRIEIPGRAAAVYYLRFAFTGEGRAAFAAGAEPLWLTIAHPLYRHAAALTPEQRACLAADWK